MSTVGHTERSLRNASRWGFALGAMLVLLGVLWLGDYLSTGSVYFGRESVRLTGSGALTAPIGALGGGVTLIGFGVYYRLRLLAKRR